MVLLKILAFFVCLVLLVIVVCGVRLAIQLRPRRRREPGFEYVYVEDDGSARELDAEERVYLSTKFEGGDGSRPYTKFRYETLTPDGRLSGYLRRRQLPKSVPIRPTPDRKDAA